MPNAYTPNMVRSIVGWSNSINPNAAFPLDFRSYFGSYEEAVQAASTAVEVGSTDSQYFFGQELFVFDGIKCKSYLIQGDGTLEEVGSVKPILYVDRIDDMLSLSDINPGQQVYNSVTGTIWVYNGGDISDINSWKELSLTWSGTPDKITFYSLTQEQYNSLQDKSSITLYFTNDTYKIYRGQYDLTGAIYVVPFLPPASDSLPGRIYFSLDDLSISTSIDQKHWGIISPGYLSDGANWAEADGSKLATISLIKAGIQETIKPVIDDINTSLDKKVDKVYGVVGNVVQFGADGSIVDSQKSIGGSIIDEEHSASKLATEQAVIDFMSWKPFQ